MVPVCSETAMYTCVAETHAQVRSRKEEPWTSKILRNVETLNPGTLNVNNESGIGS